MTTKSNLDRDETEYQEGWGMDPVAVKAAENTQVADSGVIGSVIDKVKSLVDAGKKEPTKPEPKKESPATGIPARETLENRGSAIDKLVDARS